MDAPRKRTQSRRNKSFDETHRDMIETAVRLISEKGADALSIAELARAMGINRTTVYYHFDSREELLHAVSNWATRQLAKGMEIGNTPEAIVHISRFVLENPELIKLWIDDFISGNDIRDSYSCWDELVTGLAERFRTEQPDENVDAEVYCMMMLSAAFIAPRVFANSVRPDASIDSIVERFKNEQLRALRRDGIT